MNDKSQQRLTIPLTDAETQALRQILTATQLTQDAEAAQESLGFLFHIECLQGHGYRLVLRCRESKEERPFPPPDLMFSITDASVDAQLGLVLSAAAEEALTHLVSRNDSEDSQQIAATALRVYGEACERCTHGWSLHALGSAGEQMRVRVPKLKRIANGRLARHRADSLRQLLPGSLAQAVDDLAGIEGCDPLMLLVDLIRTEATARLARHAQESRRSEGTADGDRRHAAPHQPDFGYTPTAHAPSMLVPATGGGELVVLPASELTVDQARALGGEIAGPSDLFELDGESLLDPAS